MPKMHTEIRIIWLSLLMLAAIVTGYLQMKPISYVCIAMFVSSLMYVVNGFTQNNVKSSQAMQSEINDRRFYHAKLPLYIASGLAAIGLLLDWMWLVALGGSAWLYFFLAWLERLERQQQYLNDVFMRSKQSSELQLKSDQQLSTLSRHTDAGLSDLHGSLDLGQHFDAQASTSESLKNQVKRWLFQGNPVLKVAIVVIIIGVVLLLRFATAHWQINLALQLFGLSLVCAAFTGLGYRLRLKNQAFALGLQGLGLAGLFLTLFFAHYNLVLGSLLWTVLCFIALMATAVLLSLRQNSVELVLMAVVAAYIAPLSLPDKQMTSTMMLIYLSGIHLAIAWIGTVRPWKVLNHIVLWLSTLIGTGYVLYKGHFIQWHIALLIILNLVIFIWIGLRYSQLLARSTKMRLQVNTLLDLSFICSAPLIAYVLLYVLYFNNSFWQAGLSAVLALTYAGLAFAQTHSKHLSVLSRSYYSLSFLFLSFIPVILAPVAWTAISWAILGVLALLHAIIRQSNFSQYVSMGLLVVAGLTGVYEVIVQPSLPIPLMWGLLLSYLVAVMLANGMAKFHVIYRDSSIIFHSFLFAISSMMALFLLRHDMALAQTQVLLILAISIFSLNCFMRVLKAPPTWQLTKMAGMVVVVTYAVWSGLAHYHNEILSWVSLNERIMYLVACGILSATVFISRSVLHSETTAYRLLAELKASIGIVSLALAGLAIFPAQPWLSMMLLPLIFLGYALCSDKYSTQCSVKSWTRQIRQSKSAVILVLFWVFCSQQFEQQVFQLYWLPILNPFDLISVLTAAMLLYLLYLQYQQHVDRALLALIAVLSLLWLSSYILMRALHVYIESPYNQWAIWSNMTVQMSLSLLWTLIALVLMLVASSKRHRYIWMMGASILLIVTLKLILIDLSHIGALTRVFSFLGAGSMMLLIAYLAPIPEINNRVDG